VVWTAIWHLLYLAILLGIAVLWRPTHNNTRYAYSEMSPEPDEFMLHPLNLLPELVQRSKAGDSQEDIPKQLALNPDAPVSFTITDDEEQQANKLD